MKDIKFRYWNPDIKRFIYSDEYTWHSLSERLAKFFEKAAAQFTEARHIQKSTLVKDKEGREIFEGDIVQLPDCLGVVKWNDYQAGFFIDGQDKITYSILYTFHGENARLVVGNIFENPTLL